MRLGWGDAHTRPRHNPRHQPDDADAAHRRRARRRVVPGRRADGGGAALSRDDEYDLLPTSVSFLYYEQPTNFTAIEPTGGPTGSGTLVTITGGPHRYRRLDVLCRFGENYTRVTRLQSGRIECACPRASDGLVDVSLNGIDTDFGASGYSFKYYDQPAPHPGLRADRPQRRPRRRRHLRHIDGAGSSPSRRRFRLCDAAGTAASSTCGMRRAKPRSTCRRPSRRQRRAPTRGWCPRRARGRAPD